MKLFVTDIDDTLSVGETVSAEVQDACLRLRKSGWEIMAATGRTYGAARRHMEAASVTQPAILYDGARIMSTEGEEIYSTLFDPSLAEKVLEFLWEFPAEIQVTGDEVIYCREDDVETVLFYQRVGAPVRRVARPGIFGPVYRIGLWLAPEKLFSIEEAVKAAFGDRVETASGGREFLDVLPKGVSKGSALEHFIAGLPERPELVVAAGDHNNDLTMLRLADVAVVPENAAGTLLPFADIVMPRAVRHGVRVLIDHILSPGFAPRPKGQTPIFL
ncbi:MAG: Cof-type HAD-IIB family hydrolase [Synergistaceae bacterium]|jgi:Cof subfamily protein (haloacid dehalogenase superfamily)|nr:Cof-type HAD-IIB family hydrolase [Synergistaceae bacterium]